MADARCVEVGHFLKFGVPPDEVPIGFEPDTRYDVMKVYDNGVTPPKFGLKNKAGEAIKVHSNILERTPYRQIKV